MKHYGIEGLEVLFAKSLEVLRVLGSVSHWLNWLGGNSR